MYRIIKDGANIGLTENLNYIKQAENGCYVLCPEHDASGIVFAGTVYHLLGRDTLDGAVASSANMAGIRYARGEVSPVFQTIARVKAVTTSVTAPTHPNRTLENSFFGFFFTRLIHPGASVGNSKNFL